MLEFEDIGLLVIGYRRPGILETADAGDLWRPEMLKSGRWKLELLGAGNCVHRVLSTQNGASRTPWDSELGPKADGQETCEMTAM
jgi:hypothetical protein